MPHLFNYSDHRVFLRDAYLEEKARDPTFSYALFSKRIGIRSPNYLKLVIDGKRPLTTANIFRFARGFELTPNEVEYFEGLVHLGQAETPHEKSFYLSRVRSLRPKISQTVSRKKTGEIGDWADHLPVWVCLGGLEPASAAQRVCDLTGLATAQARGSIEALKKAGLVSEEDGVYRLSSDYLLVHDRKSSSVIQKRRIRKQLEASAEALDSRYENGAKFFCHIFTIARKDFEEVVAQIQTFIQAVTQYADQSPVEQVAQLNVQLFTIDKMRR